jgi:hypothetical protein
LLFCSFAREKRELAAMTSALYNFWFSCLLQEVSDKRLMLKSKELLTPVSLFQTCDSVGLVADDVGR